MVHEVKNKQADEPSFTLLKHVPGPVSLCPRRRCALRTFLDFWKEREENICRLSPVCPMSSRRNSSWSIGPSPTTEISAKWPEVSGPP